MKYKIYRRKKRLKGVVTYSKKEPYVFNPAYRKSDKIIDIDKLSLYNSDMTNNILVKKYIKRYKHLLKMVYLLFNNEIPTGDGTPAVLSEIDKMRGIINDKYHKYITLENERLFLKELDYIEKELKQNYIERVLFEKRIIGNQNLMR